MISSVGSTPRYARAFAGGPTAAPVIPTAPTAAPAPVSAQSDTMGTLSTFLSSAVSALGVFFGKVVDFIKGLFGPKVAPETLSPEDQAIATRYSLLPTKANVAAFRAEVSSYQTNGTLGPGVQNADGVKQLQLALTKVGYPCTASGVFDQATAAAVTQFKLASGIHQTYLSADGKSAVNEYASPDVIKALIDKLQGK